MMTLTEVGCFLSIGESGGDMVISKIRLLRMSATCSANLVLQKAAALTAIQSALLLVR